jgi:hypothetical protein
MRPVQEGKLRGSFYGFKDRHTLFDFVGGGRWRQNESRYQYHYAYMPHARVVDDDGRYMLYADGVDDPVEVVRV